MREELLRDRVYASLKLVPRGKVVTYKELANSVGSTAYRAVGRMMRDNKDPKKIPCYRVIRSDGLIGNYSAKGGPNKKIAMLRKDGIDVRNGRINDERCFYSFGKNNSNQKNVKNKI